MQKRLWLLAALVIVLCLSMNANAQVSYSSPIEDMADSLSTIMRWLMVVSLPLVGLMYVLGGDAVGKVLIALTFPIWLPFLLLALPFIAAAKLNDGRKKREHIRELAEAELRKRAEFDDWLADALLRAEITSAARPDSQDATDWLNRVRTTKAENTKRLASLHDQPMTDAKADSAIGQIEAQWNQLRLSA